VSKVTLSKDIFSKDNKDSSSNEFFSLWNNTIGGKLPTAHNLSLPRKTKIKARLKERSLQEWKIVFERIAASPFCRGESKEGWRATIDWIIKNSENAVKVMEGLYDPRQIVMPHQPEQRALQVAI
jgi:hypothetical protein